MRREGAKVDIYNHERLGGAVAIRFDKASGIFRAKFGDVNFQAETIGDLRLKLRTAIEAGQDVTWQPVIKITFGRRWNDDEKGKVEFDYDRQWFARMCDGHWIHSAWDTKVYKAGDKKPEYNAHDRLAESNRFAIERYERGQHIELTFKIPFTDHEDSDTPTYYVAYTEPLWTALKDLTKTLDRIQKKLVEVLGSEKKRAQFIAGIGLRLLPGGEQ